MPGRLSLGARKSVTMIKADAASTGPAVNRQLRATGALPPECFPATYLAGALKLA